VETVFTLRRPSHVGYADQPTALYGQKEWKHQVSPGQEPDSVESEAELLPATENTVQSGIEDSEISATVFDDEDEVVSAPTRTRLPTRYSSKDVPENLTALNVYLARLKDVEILPIEEQAMLAKDYQTTGSKDAASKLVASNLRLVVKIAFQFNRQWADVMDLIAEGNVGLAEAIRKFNVEKGIPFPSYARYWIRARILSFIQEHKHLVHTGSRAARKLFWRLERERRALQAEGFEPTPKRLADRVGVTEEDVVDLAPILDHRPVSLDVPIRNDDSNTTRGDLLADVSRPGPETLVGVSEMQDILSESFKAFRETLDERDQTIWDRRLQSEDHVKLEDLGIEFGVSKERVRQLEVRIKARLKDYLKQHLGEDIIVEALR
jgi:RNA polymerase sigma-32 factor